jgi:GMP synthase-like glutamine amidotransferase
LTGGGGEHNADAEGVAWIERLKGFVGEMERGRQKCVAVCWGHQVVHAASGGTVGVMEGGGCEVCPVRVFLVLEATRMRVLTLIDWCP